MSTLSTTYLFSQYDPAQFYLNYTPTSKFYDNTVFYSYNDFFDKIGYPVPNILNFGNAIYLQYWSALFEHPWLKSALLFSVFLTVISLFGLVYFTMTYLKHTGFEGFDWNKKPANIDSTDPVMSW